MTDWLGPEEWAAVMLSLKVAFWATLGALGPGIFVAYALARWSFPGKQVVNGLVHLPLILPPVATGFSVRRITTTCGPAAPSRERSIVVSDVTGCSSLRSASRSARGTPRAAIRRPGGG